MPRINTLAYLCEVSVTKAVMPGMTPLTYLYSSFITIPRGTNTLAYLKKYFVSKTFMLRTKTQAYLCEVYMAKTVMPGVTI